MGAFSDLKVEFTIGRKGYDTAQVDEFLDSQVRKLANSHDEQALRLVELGASVAAAKEQEEAIHLTLVAATKTKDELLASAEEAVATAKEEADTEAAKILDGAKREAMELLAISRTDAETATSNATHMAETIIAEAEQKAASATNGVDAIIGEAQTEADATKAAAWEAAASTTETANAEAEQILRTARDEAITLLERVKAETVEALASRDVELELLRSEYDRVVQSTASRATQLKKATAALEAQLTAIAAGALDEIRSLSTTMAVTLPASELEAMIGATARTRPDPDATPAADIVTSAAHAGEEPLPETSVPTSDSAESEQTISGPTREGHAADTAEETLAHEVGSVPSAEPTSTPADDVSTADAVVEAASSEDSTDPDQLAALVALHNDDSTDDDTKEVDSVARAESDLETVAETDEGKEMESNGRPQRGSFYARRSAKLPRIGPEAASSTIAAINAMRKTAKSAGAQGRGADEGRAKQPA
ncbi:MAG: DivIVA domain-containing protein [Acidobacteria bacterium]|nr:DivIVA domain-containing protein [Acidobacteriota bacterium]